MRSGTLSVDSSPAKVSRSSRRAWFLVAFMWVAYCLNYADRQVIFSLFPVLKSELHFTDTQLGLTASVFLWVYALCSPLAGQIGDRFSKRRLVALSLVLWSVVTTVTGFARSAFSLLVCRGLIGVTEALFFPSAITLVANAHGPKTRSRAIAVFDTAQLAGVVLGGWYGGFVADTSDWRLAFYSLGAAGILFVVPYTIFLRGTEEEPPAETKASQGGLAIAALLRVPSYRILCLVFPAFTFVLWLLYTWLPTFVYEKFSLSLADAGFVATVYLQTGTLAGLMAGGVLADWLYARTKAARSWTVCCGMLLAAPCVHWIGSADSLVLMKVAALGFGFGAGLTMSNIMISSFEFIPSDTRASAAGCLNLVGGLVGGIASLLGGVLKNSMGAHKLMTYASLVCAAAVFVLIAGIRKYFQKDYDRVH